MSDLVAIARRVRALRDALSTIAADLDALIGTVPKGPTGPSVLAVPSPQTRPITKPLPRWEKSRQSDWLLFVSQAGACDCLVCGCGEWQALDQLKNPGQAHECATLAEVFALLETFTGIPAEQLAALPGAPKEGS